MQVGKVVLNTSEVQVTCECMPWTPAPVGARHFGTEVQGKTFAIAAVLNAALFHIAGSLFCNNKKKRQENNAEKNSILFLCEG